MEPAPRRLGNGVVVRAVVQILATADEPMPVMAICAAVNELVGQPVSPSSVKNCLAYGAASRTPRFERVASGCYRIRRP